MRGKMKFALAHLARLCLAVSILLGMATAAHANLSFNLRTGEDSTKSQKMTVDSNKCPAEGPTAAYVGGLVTNTSATTITNASVELSGLNGNVYLAGGQPASQFLGTMTAGQSIAVFWFTGFTCTSGAVANPTIRMTSSAGTQTVGLTLTVQTAISANAGGQVIGSQLGAGAVVGQTIYFDADYDFGGTDTGDEYWLQPSGGQNFNAACFRLVGSRITRSNVNAAPVGLTDTLKVIQPNKQAGNNYFISVRYFFEYLCAGQSTTARPYAVQTSGTQIKYTGNFDGANSVSISFPGATNPFTITKTVSETSGFVGATGNLTYSVTISNPSTHTAILSQIRDVLPSGMTFVGLTSDSDVTAANSSSVPASGATGTLNFIGRRGQSYSLSPGGSVTLRYTATRPASAGDFTNSAQGIFGSATTPVAQVTYTSSDVQPLTVSKISSVYSDPVNGTSDPFAIPGSIIEYLILVGNPNAAAIDADSIIVSDDTPANAKMCLFAFNGSQGPVQFADGTPSSELTYNFESLDSATDDIQFSSDDGAHWDYVPSPDADGCDANISDFRVEPGGSFAASASFSLRVRFAIE